MHITFFAIIEAALDDSRSFAFSLLFADPDNEAAADSTAAARCAAPVGRNVGTGTDVAVSGARVAAGRAQDTIASAAVAGPAGLEPRRRGPLPAVLRARVRPAQVRHGPVPDERQGALPADEERPGRAHPRRRRRAAQRAPDADQGGAGHAQQVSAEQPGDADQPLQPVLPAQPAADAQLVGPRAPGQPLPPSAHPAPDADQLGDAQPGPVDRLAGPQPAAAGGRPAAGRRLPAERHQHQQQPVRLGRGQLLRQAADGRAAAVQPAADAAVQGAVAQPVAADFERRQLVVDTPGELRGRARRQRQLVGPDDAVQLRARQARVLPRHA